MHCCAGSDWKELNFLHSSLYGAVFWICAGNAPVSWLLLNSACTALRISLCLTFLQRAGWIGEEIGKGYCRGSYPELAPEIFRTRSHYAQQHDWEVVLVLKNWLGTSLLVGSGN